MDSSNNPNYTSLVSRLETDINITESQINDQYPEFLRQDSNNPGETPPARPRGGLSQVAAYWTALMKNLHDPVLPPPTAPEGPRNRLPLFPKDDIVYQERESQPLLVVSKAVSCDEALWAHHHEQAEAELSAVKTGIDRERILDEENLFGVIAADQNLWGYSAVVVRESFGVNPTLNILFRMLRTLFSKRPDFRLILTSSAIADPEKLSEYFTECTVSTLPRETFPVQILYSTKEIFDYLEIASVWALDIHSTQNPSGDILVFLATEEETDLVAESINKRYIETAQRRTISDLVVFPVHERDNSLRIFKKDSPARRVIVTTDMASVSFRVDENVRFVIDSGFELRHQRNPGLKWNATVIAPISRAQADWRAGRAGRAGPGGRCYRIYTKTAYLEQMGPTTEPMIQTTNPGDIVLMGTALGQAFDFIDRPSEESIVNGKRLLVCLGALDEEGNLTSLGTVMSMLFMGPMLSRILVSSAGADFQCSYEVLIIVAAVGLTVKVFFWPEEEEQQVEADLKRAGLFQPEGDHLTLLAVFNAWGQNEFSSQWCSDNFVNYAALCRVMDISEILFYAMKRLNLEIVSDEKNYTNIRKAITTGLFFHVAKRDPQEGCYRTAADDRTVHIHSRSALFHRQPSCVVYEDLHVMSDGKEYMIGVTAIEPEWLNELGPTVLQSGGPHEDGGDESASQRALKK